MARIIEIKFEIKQSNVDPKIPTKIIDIKTGKEINESNPNS